MRTIRNKRLSIRRLLAFLLVAVLDDGRLVCRHVVGRGSTCS